MKGVIIYNEGKPFAKDLKEKYLDFFKEKEIEIVPKSNMKEAQFVVVIGGDGTLLRASKSIIKYNENIDVFAVNAGSLGFLTEIKAEEFKETFNNYLLGKYQREPRALLQLKSRKEIVYILNEVVISKAAAVSRILNISVETNRSTICNYKADGLIVATPTGSTAYSLSAGGPIVMPRLKVITITPLAPHNLTTRPIVIDGDEKIILSLREKEKGCIIIDGEIKRELKEQEVISISYSDKKLNLILPEGRDYYAVLRDKLKWGDSLC